MCHARHRSAAPDSPHSRTSGPQTYGLRPDGHRPPVPALTPLPPPRPPTRPHPRDELRAVQHGLCAACGRPLASRAYFFRDLDGLRVAALICMACVVAKAPVPDTPVLRVDPLLRLRLTFGTPASAPRGDSAQLGPALAAGDWDAFASPLHALLVAQGGQCALHRLGKPWRERCSDGGDHQLLYVDHDHATGLARALLCPPCNSREGWGAGSQSHRSATELLRAQPPAQACAATAGLTHRWLTGWLRPPDWRPAVPDRLPSRTRPRPARARNGRAGR